MKCEYGWHDGSCCCNCEHQKKLMSHPWNKRFGKGSMSQQCGWICDVFVGSEESSDNQVAIFYDKEHGMCELHVPRKEK